MINYTKKIIFGSILLFTLTMLGALISYSIRIILAKNLSVHDFGLFYAILTFLFFLFIFKSLGLGQALVKYISEFKVRKEFNKIKTAILSVLSIQMLSSTIIFIIIFFCAEFLAKYYFKVPSVAPLIQLFALYLPLSVLATFTKNFFQAFLQIKLMSFYEFLRPTIIVLLLLLFLRFSLGIYAPILAFIIAPVLIILILLPFMLKTFPIHKHKFVFSTKITKKLILFGFPVLITAVGGNIIGYLDTMLLTIFRSLEEVGIYNVILPTAMLFSFFGTATARIVFPMVSELWAKKDAKRLSEGLQLVHKYFFVAVVPFAIVLFVFSQIFLRLFFKQEYVIGESALKILIIGVLFYTLASINNNTLLGIGKPKTVTKIILFAAVLNLILNIILIPQLGIIGAAIATAVSYFSVLILSTLNIRKYIKIKSPTINWIKIIILGLIFLGIVTLIKNLIYTNPWLELIISISIATIIYIVLCILFKVININEIKKYIRIAISR